MPEKLRFRSTIEQARGPGAAVAHVPFEFVRGQAARNTRGQVDKAVAALREQR